MSSSVKDAKKDFAQRSIAHAREASHFSSEVRWRRLCAACWPPGTLTPFMVRPRCAFLQFSLARTLGVSKQDAQVALKGTSAGDKNELLFSRFGINYNEVPQRFRKGTTLCRSRPNSSLPVPQPQPPKVAATLSVGSEKGTQHQEVASGETLKSQTEQVPTGGLTKMSIQDADLSRDSGCGAVEHGRTANGIVTPTEAIVEPSSVKHPDNPKAAGSGVVRVVTAGGGTSRSKKRLIKKGHAPPGAIEEHACDLIRDDFWDRNPHILGESTLR